MFIGGSLSTFNESASTAVEENRPMDLPSTCPPALYSLRKAGIWSLKTASSGLQPLRRLQVILAFHDALA